MFRLWRHGAKVDIGECYNYVVEKRLKMKITALGRRKRSLYIPEDIDNFMRHKAIEEDRKFSDVLETCLRSCYGKEMEKEKVSAKRKTSD